MGDNKELLEKIIEQYGFYSEQMKSRKDKSLLKHFCLAVIALIKQKEKENGTDK